MIMYNNQARELELDMIGAGDAGMSFGKCSSHWTNYFVVYCVRHLITRALDDEWILILILNGLYEWCSVFRTFGLSSRTSLLPCGTAKEEVMLKANDLITSECTQQAFRPSTHKCST